MTAKSMEWLSRQMGKWSYSLTWPQAVGGRPARDLGHIPASDKGVEMPRKTSASQLPEEHVRNGGLHGRVFSGSEIEDASPGSTLSPRLKTQRGDIRPPQDSGCVRQETGHWLVASSVPGPELGTHSQLAFSLSPWGSPGGRDNELPLQKGAHNG